MPRDPDKLKRFVDRITRRGVFRRGAWTADEVRALLEPPQVAPKWIQLVDGSWHLVCHTHDPYACDGLSCKIWIDGKLVAGYVA